MLVWFIAAVVLCGTARGQPVVATEPPFGQEWNCSLDHRPHPDDPNKFQQSARGFVGLTSLQIATEIFDQTCPVIHQIFTQTAEGICRCSYSPELEALLDQECNLRPEPDRSAYVYSELVPNRNVATIPEMWVERSCLEVLRQNQIDGFASLNIVPMFFNASGCRCEWTQEGLDNFIAATGATKCEILFDYVFDKPKVFSDNGGNWMSMHPYKKQNNFSIQEGGNVFDEETRAAVVWRLADVDFVNLNIINSFRTFDDNNGVPQIIFSNICPDMGNSNAFGGIVDLRYRSATGTYFLDFFGRTASCTVQEGPNSIQIVQVLYDKGAVRLLVNGRECDVSTINDRSGRFEPRQRFINMCPFQIGGRVVTNPLTEGFGESMEPEAKFTGIFFFHSALRNCIDLPQQVAVRGGGIE